MSRRTVVGIDMHCFLIDAESLVPVSGTFYEPAAWNDPDPEAPNMDINEWQSKCSDKRREAERARLMEKYPHMRDVIARMEIFA